MNYNSIDLSIMNFVLASQTNSSNTLTNLKSIFGSSSVDNLLSSGLLCIEGNMVNLTSAGKTAMTPIDLSENSDVKSDSSSSLLFS